MGVVFAKFCFQDRNALDQEVQQLITEITRVATSTDFNKTALLDGSFSGVNFQIGANAGQSITLSIGDMRASGLTVNALSITTYSGAQAAISALDVAIAKVSEERGKLGAYQNRLEHTINNLKTAHENLTSSESRIRDTDMAMEMTNFTKNNILNQAAQAMLAQSNQLPQGILQLLKANG